jgi:hypothetical protein
MMMLCDVALGNIEVSGNLVTCNQQDPTPSEYISISGTATANSVSITSSNIVIELLNATISNTAPFVSQSSTVSVIFSGTNILTASRGSGIECAQGSNVTFSGSFNGVINAHGSSSYPGIGPSGNEFCQSLVILNGTYSVPSSTGGGAGIGSAGVTTTTMTSRLGNLTILGGSIIASTHTAAALGSGDTSYGHSIVDDLAILGGSITSQITGSAAAIGSGVSQYGNTSVGRLTMANANVRVSVTQWGPAIGSGDVSRQGAYSSTVEALTILSGNISATGGTSNAGIGSGDGGTSGNAPALSGVRSLVIVGGNISATGTQRAAGIGSGPSPTSPTPAMDNLTVLGGNITATGGANGAAIGPGQGASIQHITVLNGSFTLKSAHSGIGPGSSGSVQNLTIHGGLFDCTGVMSVPCFRANSVTFGTGSIAVITNSQTVATSSQWQVSGVPQLYFEYGSMSSPEEFTGIPLLHMGSILVPYRAVYTLLVRNVGERNETWVERQMIFNANRSQGCAFSVQSVGNYTVTLDTAFPKWAGRLRHNGSSSFSVSDLVDNFFPNVEYEDANPTATISPTNQFTDSPLILARRSKTVMKLRLFSFLVCSRFLVGPF